MSLRKKIIFNTLAQVVNRLVLAGSAFLVSLLIARFFGARGFGEYSKATTYIAIFYLLTDFGFNAIVLREINNNPNKEKDIISNLFGLRLLGGLILTILVIVSTFFLPYDALRNEGFTPIAKSAIIVLSLLVIHQGFLNTTNLIFQKHLRYEQSTIASIVGSIAMLISVFILIMFTKSIPVILIGYSLGALVTSVLGFVFVKKLYLHFVPSFSITESKKLIKQALPLGLTLIFNLVYFRADVFILTLFRTTSEVGTYGLAYKFFEFPLSIPTFFANSLYPILLERSNNKAVFKQTIIKAALFLLGLSFIILFIFYLLSPLLAYIRKDFFPSVAVLRLLSLSTPMFFISSLFMWILIIHGKNKQLLFIYFAGMIINILLNLMFVPLYGITAAAIITLISEFLIMIVSGWQAIKLVMI